MASSRELNSDPPATSLAPPLQDMSGVEPKLLQRIEQQEKTIAEQAAMIKALNKQLTHCESDLQIHMDEVSRLENSLADSEKNRTLYFGRLLRTPRYDFYFQCEKRGCMLLSWRTNGIR